MKKNLLQIFCQRSKQITTFLLIVRLLFRENSPTKKVTYQRKINFPWRLQIHIYFNISGNKVHLIRTHTVVNEKRKTKKTQTWFYNRLFYKVLSNNNQQIVLTLNAALPSQHSFLQDHFLAIRIRIYKMHFLVFLSLNSKAYWQ